VHSDDPWPAHGRGRVTRRTLPGMTHEILEPGTDGEALLVDDVRYRLNLAADPRSSALWIAERPAAEPERLTVTELLERVPDAREYILARTRSALCPRRQGVMRLHQSYLAAAVAYAAARGAASWPASLVDLEREVLARYDAVGCLETELSALEWQLIEQEPDHEHEPDELTG
jgi:hypothetical protein